MLTPMGLDYDAAGGQGQRAEINQPSIFSFLGDMGLDQNL